MKSEDIDITDTNLALFGTEVETRIKQEASQKEEAWQIVGSGPGLWVWRIEQFHVIPWPEEKYGTFMDGDAFICLHSEKATDDSDVLIHDIHFWLGDHCSQDESGTAAYKTVELDDFLGGKATQHREVQGFESSLFLSYFSRLRLLHGGVATGFRHVDPSKERENFSPRLFHIHALPRSKPVVWEVEVSAANVRPGDGYVLETYDTIWQWHGRGISVLEKARSAQVANELAQERQGAASIRVVDEGDSAPGFWKELRTLEEETDEEERTMEPSKKDHVVLSKGETHRLRLSDRSGRLMLTYEGSGPVNKGSLDGSDAYLIDLGHHVYVWIGEGTSESERRQGLGYAQAYITKMGKPRVTPISRVLEGSEGANFWRAVAAA
ncbi:MAG: hypothetical protein DHS80DRAFT_32698 [Piptocephalis tieghemiana]|nr:MAG: hypothetical protein DHS80DRAFT_32698 [Piptocephalis tieghemiana]